MSKLNFVVQAVFLVFLAGGAANAADFKLCNESRHHRVVEFRVEGAREHHDYSANWLEEPVRPGECVRMNFRHEDHACKIRHLIRFSNGETFKGVVNICDARRLIVRGDGSVFAD